MTEVELASDIVKWLDDQHYEVYQEVLFKGSVADIVVDINGRGWVIETKTSFGLAVIGQAIEWLLFSSTRVSVGIPDTRKDTAGNRLARRICMEKGIGIISVGKNGYVRELSCPRFIRMKSKIDILEACEDKQKTFAKAGSKGQYWTPYKCTIDKVERMLSGGEWVRFQDIMISLGNNHHYSSEATAKACLSKNLQTIEKDRFESRRSGKYLEFRQKA